MSVNSYVDTFVNGNGDVYYPKTKESAIEDNNGVSLSNKLGGLGCLIDCNCTYDSDNNTYLLQPSELVSSVPNVFSVRFKTPNSYKKNATFTLLNTEYFPIMSSGKTVQENAFASDVVIMLEFSKDEQ